MISTPLKAPKYRMPYSNTGNAISVPTKELDVHQLAEHRRSLGVNSIGRKAAFG